MFRLRSVFHRPKIVAVFSADANASRRAALHVRAGVSGLPVWLFSTSAPPDDVATLYDAVEVRSTPLALLFHAQRRLLGFQVALGVTPWTGDHGRWPMKVAPFCFPPFRALLMNRHGDFFAGNPRGILRHHWTRLRDFIRLTLDLARAGALTFLGWCAPLLRAIFRRLHGDAVLDLHVPGAGSGVDRFTQKNRDWDAEAIERFARESNARWILWQQTPSGETIEPLDAAHTFAVSPQRYFRAWQSFLFPTAPFRQLQPGEAARVLAPVSDTILVDRAKLLALGVPRCADPGTAWRILFWQAAAAGWPAYSVGGSARLCDEHAQPGPETAFMVKAARDRALRSLGPRDALLSRGNIAFQPSLRDRRGSGRLKVLVVSPFLPYPLSHGGAVRMYNLCRALSDRVDFTLIAVREKDEPVHYDRLGEIFRRVYAVDLDTLPRASGQPRMVDHYRSESLRALVAEVAREWQPDLLQLEFTQLAAYRECAPGVPALLVEHDLTFSLYRQLADRDPSEAAREEYRRWLAFERRWLRDYEGVWTMSETDREAAIVEGGRAPGRTYNIANGVDTSRYTPAPGETATPEILFVGSFRHLPNLIAFDKMAHEVMPMVWRDFPNARLRVVAGLRHEPFWSEFATRNGRGRLDPRIGVEGFVEDLRPLYARAAVVVAPLAVSAGTNIKVLEAMACGKAIVTTPAGCAGLDLCDRHDALICPDWQPFAAAVAEVLADPGLRSLLGGRARACAEARFSWGSIADRAYDSYLELTGRAPARRDIRRADEQAEFPNVNGRRSAGLAGVRPGAAETEYRTDLRR
jgi:glycosyltransferase involved in cell wall biosynthesis